MAYTAKCDTAVATKWWITGTGSTIDRLSEVMDDNASGVEEADNPGNYQPWTTFMTEDVEDADYRIHLNHETGVSGTTTNLEFFNETVRCDDNVTFKVKADATLTMEGSTLSVAFPASTSFVDGGTVNITKGSTLLSRAAQIVKFNTGNVTVTRSSLVGNYAALSSGTNRFEFRPGMTSGTFDRVVIANAHSLYLNKTPDSYNEVFADTCYYGLYCGIAAGVTMTATKPGWTGTIVRDIAVFANTSPSYVTILDPQSTIVNVIILSNNSSEIIEAYTANIHTVRDGTNEATVAVEMLDKDGNTTGGFASNNTAADGTITEQNWRYQKWVGTSETNTVYYPHRLDLTKAGLEPLPMPAITKRAPIDFRLEMQHMKPKILGRPSRRIHASNFN